jgi:hypothetical protein
MNCKDVRKELTLYLLGDITGKKASDVSGHLDDCEGCRAELEALRKTLDALGRIPTLKPSEERVRRVVREGARHLSPPRPRWQRTAFVLTAAASVLLAAVLTTVFLGPGRRPILTPDPVEVDPPGPGGKILDPRRVNPVAKIVLVKGDGMLMEIVRPDKPGSLPVAKDESLWIGDRLVSNDRNAIVKVQFYKGGQTMEVAGTARVEITGKSVDCYHLRLDSGRLSLSTPTPIEHLDYRDGSSLLVDSPVGFAEIQKGQDFLIEQAKVHYDVATWMNNRDGSFSVFMEDVDLEDFVKDNLQKNFNNSVAFNPADLSEKRISVLCKRCPREMFVDLFDRELGRHGLGMHRDGAVYRIARQPRRAVKDVWKSVAYGEFRVRVVGGGSAKISSKDPRHPGALMIAGGQEGRIMPGVPGSKRPLGAAGGILVERVKLQSTCVVPGRAQAQVLITTPEGKKERTVAPGDDLGGYRVHWIWWDRMGLVREGRDFVLKIQEK